MALLHRSGSPATLPLRYPDLALLAAALPVFLLADLPMLGYAVAAAAWLVQHAIRMVATRHAVRAHERGDRRGALGAIAGAILGRVWLVSLSILLVGLAEREAGLAAALLSVALFTVYLVALVITRLLEGEEL